MSRIFYTIFSNLFYFIFLLKYSNLPQYLEILFSTFILNISKRNTTSRNDRAEELQLIRLTRNSLELVSLVLNRQILFRRKMKIFTLFLQFFRIHALLWRVSWIASSTSFGFSIFVTKPLDNSLAFLLLSLLLPCLHIFPLQNFVSLCSAGADR